MNSPDPKHIKPAFKAGQAATELAVFGGILIFIIGVIVTTASGNSYYQNQNFKAMRMAMLASWESAKGQSTSRANASVLFVQDRLTPDIGKYGDLERNPFIVNGSGTFTYMLEYPLDPGEVDLMLPIMDVYINGQHFPFTTASYHSLKPLERPATCPSDPAASAPVSGQNSTLAPTQQCMQNQCLRNQREWIGGTLTESAFTSIVPVAVLPSACTPNGIVAGANPCVTSPATDCLAVNLPATDACLIYKELIADGDLSVTPSDPTIAFVKSSAASDQFNVWYKAQFSGQGTLTQLAQIAQIDALLINNKTQYKLFYSMGVRGTQDFHLNSPACLYGIAGKDKALCVDRTIGGHSNVDGDLMFDLQRLGIYDEVNPSVSNPSYVTQASGLRKYMAWQWTATAGANALMIGLNTTNNQYPQYDIDGRLKTVMIYDIQTDQTTGETKVSYEDYQGGDVDGTWDSNSCGPKPGLQNDADIYTFTKDGTYLQIKEGQMFNPETGQFVRSVNKRDTIDLVQRMFQLSNDTKRFCSSVGHPQTCVGKTCVLGVCTCPDPDPNPVEACVDSSKGTNCFTSDNIAKTCFDHNDNRLFIRSRIKDLRGHFWLTNATGQLDIK